MKMPTLLLGVMLAAPLAEAADPRLPATVKASDLPEAHRIENHHYVTARETAAAIARWPDILLIDVRTHEETLFNGVATPMTRHIPYVSLDIDHRYDPERQRYKLETNPDFVKAVDNLLAELKRDRTTTIIVYCSVGERSARAANLLGRSGFANAYSMVDGFEGEASAKPGPGWKASGLPWSHTLKSSQAYKSPSL